MENGGLCCWTGMLDCCSLRNHTAIDRKVNNECCCDCYTVMNAARGLIVDESLNSSDDGMNNRIFIQPLHILGQEIIR